MSRNRPLRLASPARGRPMNSLTPPLLQRPTPPPAPRGRAPRRHDAAPARSLAAPRRRRDRGLRRPPSSSSPWCRPATPARRSSSSRAATASTPARPRTAASSSRSIDEQAVASQVQVVMSRDLAREAIKQLGLVGNEEFDPLAGEIGLVRRLMILIGLVEEPARPPARGPRARELLRAPPGLSGRQIAHRRGRVPLEGSGACRQGREHDRRALP